MTTQTYIGIVRTTLEKILRIGIEKQECEIIKYAKYFTNTIAVLSATIAFIYGLLCIVNYGFSISFVYLAVVFLSLISLWLNYKGLRRLATLYILSLNAAVVIYISLFGSSHMEIYPLLMLLTFCSASTLLSSWLAIAFNVILFAVYVVSKQYANELGPWFDVSIMSNQNYINFGFTLVIIYILSRLSFNIVLRYILQLQTALTNTKNYIEKIDKQNTRLEMFSTLAAHDLRTPTRQVISFIELAKQNINAKEVDEYLNLATKAGHRMNELINAITKLKRIGQQAKQSPQSIDLAFMVSKVNQLEIAPNYKNVQVRYKGLPSIKFRPVHLQLILSNLLINAVKFNEKATKIIQINSRMDADHLYLSFTDNGIGVEEKFKSLIFQPFKKLHLHEVYAGALVEKEITQLNDAPSLFAHLNLF